MIKHRMTISAGFAVLLSVGSAAAPVASASNLSANASAAIQAGIVPISATGSLQNPCFSPDGSKIVFTRFRNGSNPDGTPGTIWKIRADGTGPTPLTSGGDDREPNWSPRGDRIVFQSLRSGSNWNLYTIASDGSGLSRLTTQPGEQTDASFTADGRYVVYSSDADTLDQAGLWAAPTSGGSSPIRIGVNRTSYDGAPSVSRDGLWIAFETSNGSPMARPAQRSGFFRCLLSRKKEDRGMRPRLRSTQR